MRNSMIGKLVIAAVAVGALLSIPGSAITIFVLASPLWAAFGVSRTVPRCSYLPFLCLALGYVS
jgi:hypothetical protein